MNEKNFNVLDGFLAERVLSYIFFVVFLFFQMVFTC